MPPLPGHDSGAEFLKNRAFKKTLTTFQNAMLGAILVFLSFPIDPYSQYGWAMMMLERNAFWHYLVFQVLCSVSLSLAHQNLSVLFASYLLGMVSL